MCLVGRLKKRSLKWSGRVERVGEDHLPKRAKSHEVNGEKRKLSRRRSRWQDCTRKTSGRQRWMSGTGKEYPMTEDSREVTENVTKCE